MWIGAPLSVLLLLPLQPSLQITNNSLVHVVEQ